MEGIGPEVEDARVRQDQAASDGWERDVQKDTVNVQWDRYREKEHEDIYSRCVWEGDELAFQQTVLTIFRREWSPWKRWWVCWIAAALVAATQRKADER